jgi:hypothetical protein
VTVPNDTASEASGARPEPAPPAAMATPAATRPPSPVWPAISATGSSFYAWLMRPRVRLTVAGALLLLVGGLIATNSVWTLPLVIVGALMVAVAWIGHRLEGRFAVEWGETGTRLAFNATIKAPQPTVDAPALSPAPSAPAPAAATRNRAQLGGRTPEVIEGEAHTVEINVSELKALIAVAEAAEAAEAADGAGPAADGSTADGSTADGSTADGSTADGSTATPDGSVRDIRIRRLADEGARTPRPAA